MMEKRKYARLNIEVNVKYKIIGQRQGSAEPAKCDNISPEGLCLTFRNAANIKIGTRLDIEMNVKDCKPFYMTGEIIWINDAGTGKSGDTGGLRAGIKFLEIHNDDESRFLLQLCDHMVKKLNKEFPSTKL